MNFKEGDYVELEGEYGYVVGISEPMKWGNITLPDGSHPTGREVILFIEEDE